MKRIAPEEAKGIRKGLDLWDYMDKVRPIVKDVRERGLEAVKEYVAKFDQYEGDVVIDPNELNADEELVRLFEEVLDQLASFHSYVAPKGSSFSKRGIRAITIWEPIDRLGAYAPGGLYPYPSTILMTAGIAKALGVKEVILATPPKSLESEAVRAAIKASKVDKVVAAGGAHGIAALAYTFNVDKVVGPGGPYVQAAKLLVSAHVPIDMVAGPTELVVIADEKSDPEEVAFDMLAQAEHGPLSFALLLSPSEGLIEAVERIVEKEKVEGELYASKVKDVNEAIKIASEIAPEHVALYVDAYEVPVAGAISLETPSPLLDYAAGPNHVLPTSGWAKGRGPLGPSDFMRWRVLVKAYPEAKGLAELALKLAEMEGMKYHAKALMKLLGR